MLQSNFDVLHTGDLLDEHYINSFADSEILLQSYHSIYIDVVEEDLPRRPTLLCYNNHLLYYYIIKQKLAWMPDVKFILVDAHQELLDERLNSCSFLRHLIEEGVLHSGNLLLLGVRVHDADDYILKHQIIQYTTEQWFRDRNVLARIKEWVGGAPVYVSVDIDVLDASIAPGCVDPEPNGVSAMHVCELLWDFASERVVGFDLAEVDLSKDNPYRTTYDAAKAILRTMHTVLCLAKSPHLGADHTTTQQAGK